MEQQLLDWVMRYGAPVVFLAQMFGIFGLPIPDELLLTVAGALIRRGTLAPAPTVLAAISGCIVGISLSYTLGRTVGLPTLTRVLHVRADTLVLVNRWFRRFGWGLLTFGYFIPGVRHVTAFAAGSTPVPYPLFAAYAYGGALVWSVTFLSLGYYGGDRWRELLDAARAHVIPVAVVALAVLLISTARRWRNLG
jgi:membrane protein DedA with SNARE-associated domain